MGLYEQKLHEFLTTPENFEFAWEVHEAMPDVVSRLRRETLDAFEARAEDEIAGRFGEGEWECWRPAREQVGLAPKAWGKRAAFAVYLGNQYRPAVSVWHDVDVPGAAELRDEVRERTRELARELGEPLEGKHDVWYWSLGGDLEALAEVRKLLPDERPDTVDGYWTRLQEVARRFTPILDETLAGAKA